MTVMELVSAYIRYRRSLGDKLATTEYILKSMAVHIGVDNSLETLSLDNCSDFLSPADATSVTPIWFAKYSAMKGLFLWAVSRGHMKAVPLPTETPRRPERMRPYIYTDAELKGLFDCALTYRAKRSELDPHTLRHILMLTYMLGLRISETLELRVNDIDLDACTVLIRESKHHKSRVVTFNVQVSSLLHNILSMRSRLDSPAENARLFLTSKGKPATTSQIQYAFSGIRREAGVKRKDGTPRQPRIHDLRHTFAVNRLTAWYREGKDVQQLLPALSTYLGHLHLTYTSVYLTETMERMAEANRKFSEYTQTDEQS